MFSASCVYSPSVPSPSLRSQGKQLAYTGVLPRRSKSLFLIQAAADVSRRRTTSTNEVLMIDPVEAKRLAAKQVEEVRATEKLKRQRQIEAINGAWAMIGLTVGLVVEGSSGKAIPRQLLDYWHAITSLFS